MLPNKNRQQADRITHRFTPVYNENSRVLILGTMPSPKSRELGFYYGHPRNRFWKVLAHVCGQEMPVTIEEKIDFCLYHHIAVWDVLASCVIRGADDASIRSPEANDMSVILDHASIRAIFATGEKAAALYTKHCFAHTGIPIIRLPSTSPANCRMKEDELYRAYLQIKEYL